MIVFEVVKQHAQIYIPKTFKGPTKNVAPFCPNACLDKAILLRQWDAIACTTLLAVTFFFFFLVQGALKDQTTVAQTS